MSDNESKRIDEEPSVLQGKDSLTSDAINTDSVKRIDAFSKIDRQITESDLHSSGTLRWLLNEHDEYKECIKQLDEYKSKYYICDKAKSIAEEKLKSNTSFEVLYSFVLSAGSALIGIFPTISQDAPKWMVLVIGGVLLIGGVIAKCVKR